jgi:hypothetical protein
MGRTVLCTLQIAFSAISMVHDVNTMELNMLVLKNDTRHHNLLQNHARSCVHLDGILDTEHIWTVGHQERITRV